MTNIPTEQYDSDPSVAAFSLNHVKNYLGVPLAITAPQDTDSVIESHLVNMPSRARAGSIALGLTQSNDDLTRLGQTVVDTVVEESSIDEQLTAFKSMKGSSTRFIEAADRFWNPVVRHVVQQNPLIGDVATLLDSTGPVTLPELAYTATQADHRVSTMLLRDDVDSSVVDDVAFESPVVYAGQAVYQFKNVLYHCGVVTERGADTSALLPEQDVWALEPWLLDFGGEL